MFDEAQDLSKLKDIHLPQNVSLFPLAIGWWIIFGLLLLLILLPFIIKALNKAYALSVRKNGFKEISLLEKSYQKNHNIQELAAAISRLLKRIALIKYDKKFIANLHSKSWADFLIRTGFNNQHLAMIISNAAYLDKNSFNEKTNSIENLKLFETARKWIRQNT